MDYSARITDVPGTVVALRNPNSDGRTTYGAIFHRWQTMGSGRHALDQAVFQFDPECQGVAQDRQFISQLKGQVNR